MVPPPCLRILHAEKKAMAPNVCQIEQHSPNVFQIEQHVPNFVIILLLRNAKTEIIQLI